MEIKHTRFEKSLSKLKRWPYIWLALLVVLTLVLHLAVIQTPDEHVFDESWYVEDANLIAEGTGTFIPQHPPLGRLIIAGGITLFGDNPFGWRIFPVLFGLAGIVLLYLICRKLDLPHQLALIAASLLALENLSFIQGSIAMLDVFSVTLMLGAFYAYLKGRFFTSGIIIAFAALAKFIGVLAIPVIGLHWLITNRKRWFRFGLAMATVPVVYLSVLPLLLWIIWGKFLNPITETITMLRLNSYSTFAEIDSILLSRPWEWLLNLKIITYWPEPHYLAMVTPSLWLLIIPSMIYMVYKAKQGNNAAIFCMSWFIGTYVVWLPINLIMDRTMYIFYLYPIIGAVCLAVAIALWDIFNYQFKSANLNRIKQWVIPGYLLIHLAFFIYLSPVPYVWKLAVGLILYLGIRHLFSSNRLLLNARTDKK